MIPESQLPVDRQARPPKVMHLSALLPIRFGNIAVLIVGGVVVGMILGVVPIVLLRDSPFLRAAAFAICLYGTWIIGYH